MSDALSSNTIVFPIIQPVVSCVGRRDESSLIDVMCEALALKTHDLRN